MSEFAQLEENYRDGVAILRLDRPPMNAFSAELTNEIVTHLETLEKSKETRAVVLWGGPKIFAAGADIKKFGSKSDNGGIGNLSDAVTQLENLPQITISAVNGVALGGGCEFAMGTDFRIAGEKARFGQPEILLGIIPGAGGTQRLVQLVGLSRAKELIYTGRQVKADEALSIGLADAVYPDDDVFDKAVELAVQYAAGPAALQNAKRAIQARFNSSHQDALDNEVIEFNKSFKTEDAKIGVKSFIQDGPGKAQFTGR